MKTASCALFLILASLTPSWEEATTKALDSTARHAADKSNHARLLEASKQLETQDKAAFDTYSASATHYLRLANVLQAKIDKYLSAQDDSKAQQLHDAANEQITELDSVHLYHRQMQALLDK